MKLNDNRWVVLFAVLMIVMLPGASAIVRVSAQQKPAQPQCPVLKVDCPMDVQAKDVLTFTAQIHGGDSNIQPTYNWTVSAGSISSGQGTSTIKVDTSEVAPDSTVTATLEAGGFDRECGYGSTTNSCTSSVLKRPEARKIQEYAALKPKEEEDRLDNFMIELNQEPSTQAYFIAYSGRTSRAGDAQKAANKARDYLINKRGLEASRAVTVTGGSREQPTIELWIVPPGAQPPKPTPAKR